MQFLRETLKRMPGTLTLVVINFVIFDWLYLTVDSTDGTKWWLELLEHGALYNPFVLDDQWYRLITSMFLHGHWLHLLLNLYGLFVIGLDLENHVGTKKFLLVYFLGGIAGTTTTFWLVYGSRTVRKPRIATRSEPWRPFSGMNGTPWLAALSPAMMV